MIKYSTLFIIITFITNFSAQEHLKDYYFPMGIEEEVKIYKYIDKNNQENCEYWKVTNNPKTNRMLTESYTKEYRLYNIFEEQLNDSGAMVVEYADFFENDMEENVRINGTVIDKDVYKWHDENKYQYSIQYKSPKYGDEKFTKKRIKKSFEKIILRGKEYSAVKFLDDYKILSLVDGLTYEYYQFTYYAKHVGMVKYQRYFSDETVVELELDKILSIKEFEDLVAKAKK